MSFRVLRFQRITEALDGKLYTLYFLTIIICGFINNIRQENGQNSLHKLVFFLISSFFFPLFFAFSI